MILSKGALNLIRIGFPNGHGSGFRRLYVVRGDLLPELADHFPEVNFRKTGLVTALDELPPSVEQVALHTGGAIVTELPELGFVDDAIRRWNKHVSSW